MTINEIEALAKKIMRECAEDGEPVTIEEAREMAELELKARGVNHTTSEEAKPRKPKVRKVDKVKAEILSEFEKALTEFGATNIITTNEVEIAFKYGNYNYSVKLIKHRS